MRITAGIRHRAGIAKSCGRETRCGGWRRDREVVMMREIDEDRVRKQAKKHKCDDSPSASVAGIGRVASFQLAPFYLPGRMEIPFNNGARRLSTTLLSPGLAQGRKPLVYPIFRRSFQIFGDGLVRPKFQLLRSNSLQLP